MKIQTTGTIVEVNHDIIPHIKTLKNMIDDVGNPDATLDLAVESDDLRALLSFYEKGYHCVGRRELPKFSKYASEVYRSEKIKRIERDRAVRLLSEARDEPFARFGPQSARLLKLAEYLEADDFMQFMAALFAQQLIAASADLDDFTQETVRSAVNRMREITGESRTPAEQAQQWEASTWALI